MDDANDGDVKIDEQELKKITKIEANGGNFPGLTQTNFQDKKDRKMTDFDLPIDDSKRVTFATDEGFKDEPMAA